MKELGTSCFSVTFSDFLSHWLWILIQKHSRDCFSKAISLSNSSNCLAGI